MKEDLVNLLRRAHDHVVDFAQDCVPVGVDYSSLLVSLSL